MTMQTRNRVILSEFLKIAGLLDNDKLLKVFNYEVHDDCDGIDRVSAYIGGSLDQALVILRFEEHDGEWHFVECEGPTTEVELNLHSIAVTATRIRRRTD